MVFSEGHHANTLFPIFFILFGIVIDSKEDNPDWIEDFLKNISTNNVQKISDLLLAEAVDNKYSHIH